MQSKIHISPWMTIGTSLVLMGIVIYLGVVNYHRDKERMGTLLEEKGVALIRSFEAGTRSGMMGGDADELHLQILLKETAALPDISYIAIVDRSGIILAHNIKSLIGTKFLDKDILNSLITSSTPRWRIVEHKNKIKYFEVYKIFLPVLKHGEHGYPACKSSMETKKILNPGKRPYIFIGMNVVHFEKAMAEDLRHNIVMAAIIVSLGIAGVISLFWAQSYTRSKKLLLDTQKLAAVGNLAAGIAHEVRNPLSSIKGYVTYFGSLFEAGSDNRKAADLMAEEVDRVNRVISELLEFARPSDLRFRQIKVMDLMDHSLRIVSHEAKTANIKIIKNIPGDLPAVNADSDRLNQVLLNLYINAIQAMEKGGTLKVQAKKKGPNLIIDISDTGKGMDLKTQKHIFDPYFTTKNKGTGLGLAIAHKIVENHNGSIQVTSTRDSGTVS